MSAYYECFLFKVLTFSYFRRSQSLLAAGDIIRHPGDTTSSPFISSFNPATFNPVNYNPVSSFKPTSNSPVSPTSEASVSGYGSLASARGESFSADSALRSLKEERCLVMDEVEDEDLNDFELEEERLMKSDHSLVSETTIVSGINPIYQSKDKTGNNSNSVQTKNIISDKPSHNLVKNSNFKEEHFNVNIPNKSTSSKQSSNTRTSDIDSRTGESELRLPIPRMASVGDYGEDDGEVESDSFGSPQDRIASAKRSSGSDIYDLNLSIYENDFVFDSVSTIIIYSYCFHKKHIQPYRGSFVFYKLNIYQGK